MKIAGFVAPEAKEPLANLQKSSEPVGTAVNPTSLSDVADLSPQFPIQKQWNSFKMNRSHPVSKFIPRNGETSTATSYNTGDLYKHYGAAQGIPQKRLDSLDKMNHERSLPWSQVDPVYMNDRTVVMETPTDRNTGHIGHLHSDKENTRNNVLAVNPNSDLYKQMGKEYIMPEGPTYEAGMRRTQLMNRGLDTAQQARPTSPEDMRKDVMHNEFLNRMMNPTSEETFYGPLGGKTPQNDLNEKFRGTDLNTPQGYLENISRIKQYGARNGFDTYGYQGPSQANATIQHLLNADTAQLSPYEAQLQSRLKKIHDARMYEGFPHNLSIPGKTPAEVDAINKQQTGDYILNSINEATYNGISGLQNPNLNKYASYKKDSEWNLTKLAKEYVDVEDTNLLTADNIQSKTLKGAYTDKEIAAMSPKEKMELAALDYRLFDEENSTLSDSDVNDLSNWIGLGGGLAAGTAAYQATGSRAAAALAALGTGIGGGYLAQYLTKKVMNAGRPEYKKYEEYSFPGVSLVF